MRKAAFPPRCELTWFQVHLYGGRSVCLAGDLPGRSAHRTVGTLSEEADGQGHSGLHVRSLNLESHGARAQEKRAEANEWNPGAYLAVEWASEGDGHQAPCSFQTARETQAGSLPKQSLGYNPCSCGVA